MKIAHLSYADAGGGGAIGAKRLHEAMLASGVDSTLYVVNRLSDGEKIVALPRRVWRRRIYRQLARGARACQRSANPIIRTLNVLPVGTAGYLNGIDADIVQMHWVGQDTISIGEIAKLNSPMVWKLPDMWAFCGAEHYLLPNDIPRYIEGYTADNRQPHESGLDLDRLVWRHKQRRWQGAGFAVVCPSQWLAKCARESALFRHRHIISIPNPLDVDRYHPRDQQQCRKAFGVDADKTLIAFASLQATRDPRKGFNHLSAALAQLAERIDRKQTEVAVIGSPATEQTTISGFKVHHFGVINDEAMLIDAYNTADCFVLPSQADNLPNVIKEVTCCGVPCVGFNVGGLPDMIAHRETGYLAKPFDAADLAAGMAWVIAHKNPAMSAEIRRRAVAMHAQAVAVRRYLAFYDQILGGPGNI